MAVYKSIIQGSWFGQAIDNILYYRTGVGFDIAGLTLGGTEDVSNLVAGNVVPKLLDCLPIDYHLDSIVTYAFHESDFSLIYQNPFTKTVSLTGHQTSVTDGGATCAIIRMNLEPTVPFANGIYPPKRGYIAVGPVVSSWIDNEGHLTDSVFLPAEGQFNALATAVSANLESLLPPAIFFPIRVRQSKVLGLWKIVSYADVKSATVRRLTSYRRSRVPEF